MRAECRGAEQAVATAIAVLDTGAPGAITDRCAEMQALRIAAGIVDVEDVRVRFAIAAAERHFYVVVDAPVEFAAHTPISQAFVPNSLGSVVTDDETAIEAERQLSERVAVVDCGFPHVGLPIYDLGTGIEKRQDVLALRRREGTRDLNAEESRAEIGNLGIVQ